MSPTTTTTGRRPGRPPGQTSDATRAALLDAMERQVATFGYDGATTRSIADEAGVQMANLRHHFGSKAGLFTATVDRAMERVATLLAAQLGDADGELSLSSALRTWAEATRNEPTATAFLAVAPIERARHAELRDPIGESAQWLEDTVRRLVAGRGAPAEQADALIAIVFGLAAYPALIDPTVSAPAVLEAAADLFDGALGSGDS